jgi:hypothetical protein
VNLQPATPATPAAADGAGCQWVVLCGDPDRHTVERRDRTGGFTAARVCDHHLPSAELIGFIVADSRP